MVVTFMAVLELVKMQRICFRQEAICGSIFVKAKAASSNTRVDAEPQGPLSIEEGNDAEAN
jgi:chromatin segregation and condensation protein Rec8/ScpA/Scc1 (kleisin family)